MNNTTKTNRAQRRAGMPDSAAEFTTHDARAHYSAHTHHNAPTAHRRTCDELGMCQNRPTARCAANQCQQGRAACPVPQACQLPEDDSTHDHDPAERDGFALVAAAVITLAACVAVGVIAISLAPGV